MTHSPDLHPSPVVYMGDGLDPVPYTPSLHRLAELLPPNVLAACLGEAYLDMLRAKEYKIPIAFGQYTGTWSLFATREKCGKYGAMQCDLSDFRRVAAEIIATPDPLGICGHHALPLKWVIEPYGTKAVWRK